MARRRKNKKNKNSEMLGKKLTCYVTADDKSALVDIREREGMSMSEVIRTALYGYYSKELHR